MTLVRSEHSKMVGVLLELEVVGESSVCIVQYWSVITFHGDVLHSPLSLFIMYS